MIVNCPPCVIGSLFPSSSSKVCVIRKVLNVKRVCWQVDRHTSVRHSREGLVVQRQETRQEPKQHVGRHGMLGIYCLDCRTKSSHFLHKMI